MPDQSAEVEEDRQVNVVKVDGGYCILGDCTSAETCSQVVKLTGSYPLLIADPPYGNIVSDTWDRVNTDDNAFADWMVSWTRMYSRHLLPGGALYAWGGTGTVGFRPFFKYLTRVEQPGEFELSTLITWSKRRAYGIQWGYLFTREELAYFVKGNAKKPRLFNVPLLEIERGYEGYDKAHPALSKFYRRTNVWNETEILRGKLHTAQKLQRHHEVMIETHTTEDEWVIDIFGGSGTTAHAARKFDRKFVVVEKDETEFEKMLARLK